MIEGRIPLPRINIEDSWWSDPRRTKLILKLGSGLMADGLALSCWHLSQTFYKNGCLVPRPQFFAIDHAQALIDALLAEDRGDFIYVKGSKEHHSWLNERSEAGKRGAAKTNEILHGKPRQTTPSSSYSYSYSKNLKKIPSSPKSSSPQKKEPEQTGSGKGDTYVSPEIGNGDGIRTGGLKPLARGEEIVDYNAESKRQIDALKKECPELFVGSQ